MSRVAKAPIILPKNVELTLEQKQILIKGPKGLLKQNHNRFVNINCSENDENNGEKVITVKPIKEDTESWAQAGTMRALIFNMVKGVSEGFQISLDLVGVGYRVQTKAGGLSLSLGYSHPIEYALPEGVTAEAPSNTNIILKGIDKQKIGQVAAIIRGFRPPEPYKGKGVKYTNEIIIRKETKKK